jgi:hypothetical protein
MTLPIEISTLIHQFNQDVTNLHVSAFYDTEGGIVWQSMYREVTLMHTLWSEGLYKHAHNMCIRLLDILISASPSNPHLVESHIDSLRHVLHTYEQRCTPMRVCAYSVCVCVYSLIVVAVVCLGLPL